MKYVSNGYTQPNSNPKTLTTLTLTLTLKPSRPFKEFLSANPNRNSYASEHAMYRNLCLISRLTVILTLYDVNLTLANVYDAFEKNCRRGPDSNLKTINHEACHATSSTIWVTRYGLRKAQIMYNCGSRFSDVTQRSPSICDLATSRGPQDTSYYFLPKVEVIHQENSSNYNK